jgi:hypothetical protein
VKIALHTVRGATLAGILASALVGGGCRGGEEAASPLVTPVVTTSKPRAPLGSPIEVTYKFTVAPAARLDKDYRVFVHFVNADDEQMWTDDHDPPRPASSWQPGETIEYTRTVFVPIYPYIGPASIVLGLYAPADGSRVPMTATDRGQRAYTVGQLELLPQSENVFLIFKEGWHDAEVAKDNPAVEWQWTKRAGTIAFRNPRRDVTFFLHVDGRPDLQAISPQPVTVSVGGQVVDRFNLASPSAVIRKVPIAAAQLGAGDTVEITIDAGSSFVPARTPAAASADPRELGVRVFHAFVEPR